MGSPASTLPQNALRQNWKANTIEQGGVFSAVLNESIGEGIKAALGQAILAILKGQGVFDNASSPKEFHLKLQTVFGSGATVIEKIIIKDLFRRLNLHYVSQDSFNYGEDLEKAKKACPAEASSR